MNYIVVEGEKIALYETQNQLSAIAGEIRKAGCEEEAIRMVHVIAAQREILRRFYMVNAAMKEKPPFREQTGEEIELIEAPFIGDCAVGHGAWFDPDGKPAGEGQCPRCAEEQDGAEAERATEQRVEEARA
jgi:hypothetical protein